MTTEKLAGEIEQISFHNAENDYVVARLRDSATAELVTVVGHLSGSYQGQQLDLTGRWQQHPRFGRQFVVESYQLIYPDTAAGIEKYLASGMIKGIGPRTAERIVAAFGPRTLEVIELEPERLAEVPGLGRKRRRQIGESWDEQRGLRKLMVFLQGFGVGSALSLKIWRHYREKALEAVRSNPYRLAEEIHGIGFATADRIALSLGVERDSPFRVSCGLAYAAEQCQEQGHTCLPRGLFLQQAVKLLGLEQEVLDPLVARLAETGQLMVERDSESGQEFIYPHACFIAEELVVQGLSRLIAERDQQLFDLPRLVGRYDKELRRFEQHLGIELSDDQRQAVEGALHQGVAVITGGPGTGKTTVIAALLEVLRAGRLHVVLAAPTGRAAKRITETTGEPASTIHRLLGWSFGEGRFLHHSGHPLEGEMFIVDEVSMVDIQLFASLVEALPNGAGLILVGDVDQLPSIGPGKVLADLIASRRVPVYRLNQIFRQASRSLIVRNAHRVRQGLMPVGAEAAAEEDRELVPDFYLVNQPDPAKAREMVVRLAAERIESRFEIDPASDLQVISPMNKGACGTIQLNRSLQEALNPRGEKITLTGREIRLGDRVMQIRNDYEKDVFNGDVGRVLQFDAKESLVTVDFEGRRVEYDALELEDLVVAYAITVHKSQGCEYPAVVLTLLGEHYVMLQRNLLYTALTRGRRVVVLVGDMHAVQRAVNNAREQFRCTRLARKLAETLKHEC